MLREDAPGLLFDIRHSSFFIPLAPLAPGTQPDLQVLRVGPEQGEIRRRGVLEIVYYQLFKIEVGVEVPERARHHGIEK